MRGTVAKRARDEGRAEGLEMAAQICIKLAHKAFEDALVNIDSVRNFTCYCSQEVAFIDAVMAIRERQP